MRKKWYQTKLVWFWLANNITPAGLHMTIQEVIVEWVNHIKSHLSIVL